MPLLSILTDYVAHLNLCQDSNLVQEREAKVLLEKVRRNEPLSQREMWMITQAIEYCGFSFEDSSELSATV